MEKSDLLHDHRLLTQQLADIQERLGHLLPEERAAKNNAFLLAPEGTSDRMRGELAQQASLHLTREILVAQRAEQAATAWIEDIRLQLHYS